ncbi:MAG: hypothetical protein ACI4JB_09930 [Porcipelethomonas sp.]
MWRIKVLTEQFGMCGIGWRYEITDQWIEPGANGEKSAFCNIKLYVRSDGEWSEPIPGTGGSSFISAEKSGLYTSDECYKMALTDAISVACKALGVAADVYWESDRTKYDSTSRQREQEPVSQVKEYRCSDCGKLFESYTDKNGKSWGAEMVYELSVKRNADGKARCSECMKKHDQINLCTSE